MLKDGAAVYTPGLSERRGTMSKFYHGDALGSTRGITNGSQTVVIFRPIMYQAFSPRVFHPFSPRLYQAAEDFCSNALLQVSPPGV